MVETQKDIIVVAREGYTVLLNINEQTLDIDCYNPVNLSKMFSGDAIERCTSLEMHLQEGNLIYYENQELPKNPDKARVDVLRQANAKHIQAQYDQTARNVVRTDMELETQTNIDDAMRVGIQEQVQAGKAKILQTGQKRAQRAEQSVREVDVPLEKRNAMTPDELNLKVSMDVSPDEFMQKQKALKKKFDDNVNADEIRAEKEIISQEDNEENV